MTAFNVLITDGLNDNGQAILGSAANVDDRTGISPKKLLQVIKDYDALIVRSRTRVTEDVIRAAEHLKVIGRAGVGVDNIDLEAARRSGVTVINAPGSITMAAAELTFGLMLTLSREIPRADAAMKQGEWPKKDLVGVELNGKTIGILGMGRIGGEVGRRAVIFGMDVIAYDPLLPDEVIRQRWAKPTSLEDLYARSDYISFHLPLTDMTHSMVNEQAFGRMKHGVRLICAARGGIIDEPALLAALNSGQVAGAALDVFAHEPPGATELVKHPKVIATPHLGAQTVEAQSRAADDIANEVLAALKGESLRWKVV